MIGWIKRINGSSTQTKFFVLNWIIYGLALLITTLYCYGRLDYVRSYVTPGTTDVSPTEDFPTNNHP